ncbi:DNA ligase [Enterobacter phage 02_vB_Eclo_IJM]|nr:DNA ligase [Enterobacter phage 02_vB_Eclo_IJM]
MKYDGVRLNLPVFPTGETQWLSRELNLFQPLSGCQS